MGFAVFLSCFGETGILVSSRMGYDCFLSRPSQSIIQSYY